MSSGIVTSTVVRFEARGSAREFMAYRGTEVLLSGPAGSGKTVAALMKLHLTALKVPGLRGLILRKTHASLTATTLATFDQLVAKEAIAAGVVKFYGGSARAPASYRYSNGSVILVGGLDRGPEKYLSLEVDRVFIDEAVQVTEADVETLLTRLRGKAPTYKQLTMATNPSAPSHWLKQRCNAGTCRILYSTYRDNPYFTAPDGTLTAAGEDYMAKLDGLSGVRRKRLLDGTWCAAEGQIYEGFDEAVHLVDRFDIPDNWVRWWTVDFGFVHPFVLQCWAQDGDGRLYLYREIFHTGRLVEDHARQILTLVTEPVGEQIEGEEPADAIAHGRRRWTEPKPRAVICDHDAEGRATLQRHLGMSTVAANKRVSEGIQAVQARYKIPADGRPRLVFLRDSVVERDPALVEASRPSCTVDEIGGYVWAVKPGGAQKEEPVKEMDDGMDATRYMVAKADLGSRPNVRWL